MHSVLPPKSRFQSVNFTLLILLPQFHSSNLALRLAFPILHFSFAFKTSLRSPDFALLISLSLTLSKFCSLSFRSLSLVLSSPLSQIALSILLCLSRPPSCCQSRSVNSSCILNLLALSISLASLISLSRSYLHHFVISVSLPVSHTLSIVHSKSHSLKFAWSILLSASLFKSRSFSLSLKFAISILLCQSHILNFAP